MNKINMLNILVVVITFYILYVFPINPKNIDLTKKRVIIFIFVFKYITSNLGYRVLYKSTISVLWIILFFSCCNLFTNLNMNYNLLILHKYILVPTFSFQFLLMYFTLANNIYKKNYQIYKSIK